MSIKKANQVLPDDVCKVAFHLNQYASQKMPIKPNKRNYQISKEENDNVWNKYFTDKQRREMAKQIRVSYINTLSNLGWTYTSIAEAFEITRERVRQICQTEYKSLSELKAVVPLPIPPEWKREPKPARVIRVPDEDTIARLKELHEKAKLVRYTSTLYRKEAEEFTYLLNYLVNVEKITTYRIAKLLGVTHAGLDHRLVRYGYKTTNGNSRAYDKLLHRTPIV